MPFKLVLMVANVIFLVLFSSTPAAAETGMLQPISIDGHSYDAHLEQNHRLGITEGEHYEGYFPEDPNSWVRVSRLGTGWEGIAYVFGSMHPIGGSEKPTMYGFSQMEEPLSCGVDHGNDELLMTPDSLIGPEMAQAVLANYGELCTEERVDGVCLMLELEMIFDKQFQDRFENSKERAGAILNMVDGYYKDGFGIILDTLSLTFLNDDQDKLFSDTTKAGALLNSVEKKRNAVDFIQSKRSVLHFVSGRNFDGNTVGLAWAGSLGYANGQNTSISSASNDNVVTALVITHEIGHNLGSGHDGQPGNGAACPGWVNIMSPVVANYLDGFSECSYGSITWLISSRNVEQSFNFPADVSLSAVAGNPSEVEQGASFQANFQIDYQDSGFQKADRITASGVIDEGGEGGRLLGVSLDGSSCALTGPDGKSDGFDCPDVETKPGLTLSIQAEAGTGSTFNLLQNTALVSNSGEVKDILPQNNELLTQIAFVENNPAAPERPGNDSARPTPDTSTNSDSGSGGGGAANWMWLLVGAFAVACRQRQFK